MNLYLDFETSGSEDLGQVGAWAYAQHLSTTVLLAAWAVDDGPVAVVDHAGGERPPRALVDAIAAVRAGKGRVVAHNAEFEFAVWRYVWSREHPELGPPPDWPAWQCTAAQCARAALPRDLARASRLICPDDAKASDLGQRYTRLFTTPGTGWARATKPEAWAEWVEYCRQDVVACRALHRKVAPLFDPAVWVEVTRINERGMAIDRAAVHSLARLVEAAEVAIKARFEDGLLTRVAEVKRRLEALLQSELNNLRAETLEELLDREDLDSDAADLIRARLAINKTSTKKLHRMLAASERDGRVRGAFVFGKAHTGRHAGAIFQPHNLPRDVDRQAGEILDGIVGMLDAGMAADDVIDMLGGPREVLSTVKRLIRPCIVPAPGHRLVTTDYNAIEGRLTMWLAGAKEWLRRFASDDPLEHPYVAMGAMLSGRPPAQCTKETGPEWRQRGKVLVLGAGYGLGPRRLVEYGKGAGLDLSPEESERYIAVFRTGIPEVPAAWEELTDAFLWCLEPGRVGQGRYVLGGRVIVWGSGSVTATVPSAVHVRLPSGRRLTYFSPAAVTLPGRSRPVATYLTPRGATAVGSLHVAIERTAAEAEMDPEPYHAAARRLPRIEGWTRVTIWGGKLLENIVQATAADIHADGLVQCAAAGLPVVFHAHDEFVIEILEAKATKAKEAALRIARTMPAWATDLPMDAEASICTRYGVK